LKAATILAAPNIFLGIVCEKLLKAGKPPLKTGQSYAPLVPAKGLY
jgi:hypothetical protein